MIYFKTGSIFDSEAEALVNPVNCVGVIGKGLALQFKEKYPKNYNAYKKICIMRKLSPGQLITFPLKTEDNPKFIINFPTKYHWKMSSQMEDIHQGLCILIDRMIMLEIKSIAIPALGCGLGELPWEEVKKDMIKILGEISFYADIFLYEPFEL